MAAEGKGEEESKKNRDGGYVSFDNSRIKRRRFQESKSAYESNTSVIQQQLGSMDVDQSLHDNTLGLPKNDKKMENEKLLNPISSDAVEQKDLTDGSVAAMQMDSEIDNDDTEEPDDKDGGIDGNDADDEASEDDG